MILIRSIASLMMAWNHTDYGGACDVRPRQVTALAACKLGIIEDGSVAHWGSFGSEPDETGMASLERVQAKSFPKSQQ